jgi:hypothetical protein
VTNLGVELRDLAPFVELPPERDLAPSVRARIGARRRPRPGRLVLALALVLAALAVAFAVPPARSAILRWLGLGNARIEFVDRLPDVRTRRPLDLGVRVSLGTARKSVRYHVLTSKLLGNPKEVHLRFDQIAFVYGDHKLVVLQSEGTFFTKEVGPLTHVDRFSLDGAQAIWVSGAPHFFGYVDANGQSRAAELYLVGNALIWQRGPLTLRLEAKLSRAEAVQIARSFR